MNSFDLPPESARIKKRELRIDFALVLYSMSDALNSPEAKPEACEASIPGAACGGNTIRAFGTR